MIAYRRPYWNFTLDRAVEWSLELNKPLVILEALRCGHQWASDRFHRFVLDGMQDNAAAFSQSEVLYYPYVEPAPNAGKGLLKALSRRACVVVTDDFPCFFLPRMVTAAASQVVCLMEQVDSNGLLPLRATDRVFNTAYSFRNFLQKNLPRFLLQQPAEASFREAGIPAGGSLVTEIEAQWPPASRDLLAGSADALSQLPIDHQVKPAGFRGGHGTGTKALSDFVRERLPRYEEDRNEPDLDATSNLSPYLHWGHLSAHHIFHEVMEHEAWTPADLGTDTRGKRQGWWGVGPSVEMFLDQLVTWREIGFNMCALRNDYDRYASLPPWAQETLEIHAHDERPYLYDAEELEHSRTHDDLWNAAQMQLLREGRLHNYLRMLWGKKILEWTPTPEIALRIMIDLNNKYAMDGRDPNSYSGIFWCLGRYDRPWGPERPIFGKVRFMSSVRTAAKVRTAKFVKTYAP
jgi:deoxyribodipyrimidine photo-lyase